MAFVHGKSTCFKLDNAAGSLVDYSAYLNDLSFPQTVETGETTTFGKNDKTYIVGLGDSTISASGLFDSAADTTLQALVAALKAGTTATATFEYGPEGSATGKIKYTGEAIVTSYEVSGSVGDVVSASLELQVTGPCTRTTF